MSREGRRKLGRGLVSVLGRVARVAADVGDQERPHAGDRPAGRARRSRRLHRERLAGCGDQLAAGREAIVRLLRERLLRRPRRSASGRSGRSAVTSGGGSFRCANTTCELAVALERRRAGQALVEHAAERVDVGARVDGAALDLLGRDVGDRARRSAVAGQARDRRGVPREAEVAEVGVLRPRRRRSGCSRA